MKTNTNKVAIVTGSSRGIGAAIAKRLASDGLAVVINYAGRAADAEKVVQEIEAAGGRAIAINLKIIKYNHLIANVLIFYNCRTITLALKELGTTRVRLTPDFTHLRRNPYAYPDSLLERVTATAEDLETNFLHERTRQR